MSSQLFFSRAEIDRVSEAYAWTVQHRKIILAVVLVVLFATFVWPTRYRYGAVSFGRAGAVYRINRITDHVEFWMYGARGWYSPETREE